MVNVRSNVLCKSISTPKCFKMLLNSVLCNASPDRHVQQMHAISISIETQILFQTPSTT